MKVVEEKEGISGDMHVDGELMMVEVVMVMRTKAKKKEKYQKQEQHLELKLCRRRRRRGRKNDCEDKEGISKEGEDYVKEEEREKNE